MDLLDISLWLSFGGALIQRAEIIPFEPDAVSTDEGTRVLNDLKYYSPFSWLLTIGYKRLVHTVYNRSLVILKNSKPKKGILK